MALWRDYLEGYAEREGDVEGQTVVAAYKAVEALNVLCRILDRNGRYKDLIDQRLYYFQEAARRAEDFVDCLITATFSIYNCLNTLSHQFSEGNLSASELISKIDEQVHLSVLEGKQIERPAAAMRSCFPLTALLTITLDQNQLMTDAIRQVEQRFAAGTRRASSGWEHLLNALYRTVEMLQLAALLTDAGLKDQIYQIAARFQEEDQPKELRLKLRNGFCRLFELTHLIAVRVNAIA